MAASASFVAFNRNVVNLQVWIGRVWLHEELGSKDEKIVPNKDVVIDTEVNIDISTAVNKQVFVNLGAAINKKVVPYGNVVQDF